MPAIQRPLAVPRDLESGGEWGQIGNGPGIAVWAAGADEVTKEMQVEAEERERGGHRGTSGGGWRLDVWAECEAGQRAINPGSQGNQHGKSKCMQGVVILREPQQRMAGVAGEEFRNDA